MTFAGCRDAIRESGDEQAITRRSRTRAQDASDAVMGGVVMQRQALFQSISRAENKHLIDGVRRHVAASDGPRLLEVFWGKPNVLTGEIACLNDDGADRNHAAAKVLGCGGGRDTATDQATPDATLSARRPQWCLRLARADTAAATVKVEGDVSSHEASTRAVMPTPAWAFEEGLDHTICSAIGGSGVAGTTLRELCAHLGCESKMLGKARAPLLRRRAPVARASLTPKRRAADCPRTRQGERRRRRVDRGPEGERGAHQLLSIPLARSGRGGGCRHQRRHQGSSAGRVVAVSDKQGASTGSKAAGKAGPRKRRATASIDDDVAVVDSAAVSALREKVAQDVVAAAAAASAVSTSSRGLSDVAQVRKI